MAAAIDATNVKSAQGTSVTGLTITSCTVGALDNFLLVVDGSYIAGYGAPTSMTWNGAALAMKESANNPAAVQEHSLWYLANPTPGTGSLVAVYPVSAVATALAFIPMSGVNTAAPFGTVATATGNANNSPTVTAAGGTALDVYIGSDLQRDSTQSVGGSQTSVTGQSTMNSNFSFDVSQMAGTGTGIFAWTGTGTVGGTTWTCAAVAIKGVAAPSSLIILLDDPLHSVSSTQLLVGAALDDHTGEFLRNGGVKLKQWAADVNTMMGNVFDVTQSLGDAALTVTLPTTQRFIYQNVTLTANRTIALPTSGLIDGMKFRVVRDAATPGAFTLTITGARANIVIPANTNGYAGFRAIAPTALVCEGQGTLP